MIVHHRKIKMATATVCDVDPELLQKLKKFRFKQTKENAAIIMKINAEKLMVILDEELDECSIEELRESLPEHLPRYVVLIYKNETHSDGRVSFPMCFIYLSPLGCKPEMQMMYAGSKLNLVNEAGLTKVFELRDVEELTEEWLQSKLAFFR